MSHTKREEAIKRTKKKCCNKEMECRNVYVIKSFLCYHMLFMYKQRVMTSGWFLLVPARKKAGALG